MPAKMFPLGTVLTVTTGRLYSPDGMGGVYKILNHLSGQKVMTHQIPRVLKACQPHVRAQFPHLPGDNEEVKDLEAAVARWGPHLMVEPLPAGAVDMVGKDRVVVVSLAPEDNK